MTKSEDSHLNKSKLDNLSDEIWKSAERLRGKFKAHEYQNVVLPIITIRRLECVLINWREKKAAEISKKRKNISAKEVDKLVKKLELNPKQSPGFSNSTKWTLRKIYEEDQTLLEKNFRAYLKGFSENVQDILDNFDYRAVVGQMVKRARLAPILNQYSTLDVGPDKLSSLEMGYIYEDLLRRFSEQHAEKAGDHFTPREVIRLMVELLEIPVPEKHTSIYDPACGTGGMLYVTKEHLLDKAKTEEERQRVHNLVTLNGTELMNETYAIAQSEALIRGEGQTTIHLGNSLIPHDPKSKEPGDQFPESHKANHFDYMLSNPPFGVTWGGKDGYQAEAEKLSATRYKAGMPGIGDGSLLFLQAILAKMKTKEQGGSKAAIIFNGSPLSNGDCGSGESEIRRWVLENDWLDAIIMLPKELFYNTGIYTYIWLLRNDRQDIGRAGRIKIIDARKQSEKEPRSFGSKRNRIVDRHCRWIEGRYLDGWEAGTEGEYVKFYTLHDFAFHKVEVVFWQTDEEDCPAIVTEPYVKKFTAANVKKEQEFYDSDIILHIDLTPSIGAPKSFDLTLKPEDNFTKLYNDAILSEFKNDIELIEKSCAGAVERKKAIKAFKATLDATVRYTHRHYIKDNEYIPFDVQGDPKVYIPEFLEREIDKEIIRWGDRPQLGYEVLPNKYFYRYKEPPSADDLLDQFWSLEEKAEGLLKGLSKELV